MSRIMQKVYNISEQYQGSLKFFLHVLLPVVIGTLVYILWRGINLINTNALLTSSPPDWFKYSLPDGLWLYALLSAIIFIWKEKFSTQLFRWLLLAISLSFFSEVLQAYNIIQGTFDLNDLFAYSLATILCLLNFKPTQTTHN
jgi:hypothetical protein